MSVDTFGVVGVAKCVCLYPHYYNVLVFFSDSAGRVYVDTLGYFKPLDKLHLKTSIHMIWSEIQNDT